MIFSKSVMEIFFWESISILQYKMYLVTYITAIGDFNSNPNKVNAHCVRVIFIVTDLWSSLSARDKKTLVKTLGNKQGLITTTTLRATIFSSSLLVICLSLDLVFYRLWKLLILFIHLFFFVSRLKSIFAGFSLHFPEGITYGCFSGLANKHL